jgi:hypothetical protein
VLAVLGVGGAPAPGRAAVDGTGPPARRPAGQPAHRPLLEALAGTLRAVGNRLAVPAVAVRQLAPHRRPRTP